MKPLALAIWVRLPVAIASVSRTLAVILSDGAYLTRWPALAVAGPPVAFLWGALLSQTRSVDQVTYTYSILDLVMVVVIAGFGAGLGLYLTLGYALCDFFLFEHDSQLLTLRPALLASYLLLAVLTVLMPLSARLVRRRTLPDPARLGPVGRPLDALLAAVIVGGGVFLWTESSAVLIRPLFVWTEAGVPTDEAIHPLQQLGWVLALAAAAVAAVRTELEARAGGEATLEIGRAFLRHPGRRLPPLVAAVADGAFLTFLIGGLLDSWVEVPLVLAALVAIAALRRIVPGLVPLWPRVLGPIPMIFRIAAGIVATAFVGQAIITAQFDTTQSLWPVAAAAVAGMLIMTLLVPDLGGAGARGAGQR